MPIAYNDIKGSTAIQRIGYDTVTGELRIVFKDKFGYPEYIWGGVEPKVIENFFLAGSKGKYYHQWIKGRSEYRVRPAFGSFRLSAIGRGLPKAPSRFALGAKRALEYGAELILPLR